MHLNIRNVTRLFNVSDKTIYKWIKKKNLPYYEIDGNLRFNWAELLEWATPKNINMSPFTQGPGSQEETSFPGLAEALRDGGIHYKVPGIDVASALKAVVERLPLSDDIDRNVILQIMIARENMGSTGVGNGISIPHPRNPVIIYTDRPIVSLCFLEKPVDFHSYDRKPVNTLFTLISPTIRCHLDLLSRISFSLGVPEFLKVIQEQKDSDTILLHAAAADSLAQLSESGEES
jgi:PTS system nitrogen regulatory IIA component